MYKYSFDTVRPTLSPEDFVQEQNDLFEETQEDFDFLDVDNFDPYEIV
jgi:hypothetical protein